MPSKARGLASRALAEFRGWRLWGLWQSWMEASVFFRFLSSVSGFLGKVAAGSFVLGPFFAMGGGGEAGFFRDRLDRLLNRAKPLAPPRAWPARLASLMSGSVLASRLSAALDTPFPKGGGSFWGAALWALTALPAWGAFALVAAGPALPTTALFWALLPAGALALLGRKIVVGRYAVALALFAFVNAAAAFFSVTMRASIEIAAVASVFMLFSVLLPSLSDRREAAGAFILAFLLGALIAGLVGLYQHFAGYAAGAWLAEEQQAYVTFRVFSTFGNPNIFGFYLLLAIPLSAAGAVIFRSAWLRLSCLGLGAVLLANLLLTYSRGSYLALALSAGVIVMLMEKRLLALFLPALAGLFLVLPHPVVARLQSVLNFEDLSTSFRFSIWEGSVRLVRDFWMTGVGQGSQAFSSVYSFYALAATPTLHAHNLYLQLAAELGVPGLLVFLGLMACYFREMADFHRRAAGPGARFLAAVFIAAPLGVLFQGLVDHVFFGFGFMFAFYSFLGIGLLSARVLRD